MTRDAAASAMKRFFLFLIFRVHADRVQPCAGCGEIYDYFQSVSTGAKVHH